MLVPSASILCQKVFFFSFILQSNLVGRIVAAAKKDLRNSCWLHHSHRKFEIFSSGILLDLSLLVCIILVILCNAASISISASIWLMQSIDIICLWDGLFSAQCLFMHCTHMVRECFTFTRRIHEIGPRS